VEAHDSGITSGGSCGLRGDYRRRVVVATNGNGRTEEIKGGRRRGGGIARAARAPRTEGERGCLRSRRAAGVTGFHL
jgi:hypothetical protein